jgi:Bacterial Ig-like domain
MKKPSLIKILFPFFLLILFIPQTLVQTGCANIIPPEGGPRDSLPPVLRRASPADSSRNFGDNRITLTFDEYVDADNYLQEMIVSPVPANMPVVSRKLNTVTVKLRDTLEPNTTYTLNFGNTIKDVNEGNPMKNFTYIFSTGPYIDSLEFNGNVLLAETGEKDTTLTVLLHKTNIDSALIKEKPRYVTKLDGRGNFRFKNLPPGTFYAYALKDEGGSYRYMSKTQLFAFSDSAVVIGGGAKPITLYAYAGKETTPPVKPAAETTRNTKPADKRLKFSTNLSAERQDLLDKFIMTFESKLKNFDTSKVHFSTDTTFIPISGYSWEMDSTKKIMKLDFPWQENVLYNLVLEKDFATDTLGYQLLKADTISLKAKEKKDYGKLTLRFRNLDLSQNPVLLFVQNNEVKKSFPLSTTNFSQELFIPGDYNLRILNDRNKNGMWDPGVFFGKQRQQPELVKPVQRTLNIKADRDNSMDIDVNAAPPKENDIRQPTQNPALRGRPNNNTRPTKRSEN